MSSVAAARTAPLTAGRPAFRAQRASRRSLRVCANIGEAAAVGVGGSVPPKSICSHSPALPETQPPR